MKKLCRNCKYFEYAIHHRSTCYHKKKPREGRELRDGRAIACEKWKEKPKKKKEEFRDNSPDDVRKDPSWFPRTRGDGGHRHG